MSFIPSPGGDSGIEVFATPDRASEQKTEEEELTAQHCVWQRVDRAIVLKYHHPLPVVQSSVPSTAASQPVSSPSTSTLSSPFPLGMPTSVLRSCDGCGLVDWREQDEFVCVDGCSNFRLCHWCKLHDRFNTATHASQHHMDHRLPAIPPASPTERESFQFTELCGGVMLADSERLIILPPPLPSTSLRHWRDFAVGDVVDVRDMYQKWYQADVLAVNAGDKSVLVHYQGWHTKWDEWISTNTDRFAPRGSLSTQNKAASGESAGHRQDGSEGGRKAVRQAARVLQLVPHNEVGNVVKAAYEHCTDVVVRSRGQAFACIARTKQVWCIDEDGVMEHWHNDSKPADSPSLTINQDSTIHTLDAARVLIAACPVLSVGADSMQKQLALIRTLLRQLLGQQQQTVSSTWLVALLLSVLDYLTRLLYRIQRSQLAVTSDGHAVLDEIRALLQSSASPSTTTLEPIQSSSLGVLVAGLPLFFPAWEQRLAFASSLHNSLSTEQPSQHSPQRLALAALGTAAHSAFSNSDGVVLSTAAEKFLFDPSTLVQAVHLLDHLRVADQSWLSGRLAGRRVADSAAVVPRHHVYLLVSFLSQLYTSMQPVHFSPSAVHTYSALTPADNRNLSGLLPFLTLSTAVMERVNSILKSTSQRLQQMEDETGARPSADSVLEELRSCALFHVMAPLLSWLPEVLQLVASGVYEHYMQLDTVLQQLVPLMVDMARLVQLTESTKQLPLPQLLASLRESRQLTTLQSRQGVPHRTLTPFARQVFTSVFRHFSTAQPEAADAQPLMGCDDFILLYSHCHLPSTAIPPASAGSSLSMGSPPGAPPTSGMSAPVSKRRLRPNPWSCFTRTCCSAIHCNCSQQHQCYRTIGGIIDKSSDCHSGQRASDSYQRRTGCRCCCCCWVVCHLFQFVNHD